MVTETLSRDNLVGLLIDYGYEQSAFDLIDRWLARGDSVLVYRNHDLGHPEQGHPIVTSYGGPQAQVERTQFPEPPDDCPVDLSRHGLMAWRYRLAYVVSP